MGLEVRFRCCVVALQGSEVIGDRAVLTKTVPTFAGDVASGTEVTVTSRYRDTNGIEMVNIRTADGHEVFGLVAASVEKEFNPFE